MKHKLSWLIVCLLVLLLGACKKDPIARTEPISPIVPSEPAEPEKTPAVEEGQALVKFTVDERYNGFVLSTSAEEIIIGKALNEVRSNSNRCVQSFLVNDGDQVAAMNLETGTIRKTFTVDSEITSVDFSAGSNRMAILTADGLLSLYDTRSFLIQKSYDAMGNALSCAFHPDESTKDAFLLPIDAEGTQTEGCYPLTRLYNQLGSLGAKSVVVFLDACFSGAQRNGEMLASARGIALRAKNCSPQGNMVVFSAASGDEMAFPYTEKNHGMFTYFLLKKLQETKGNVNLKSLSDYVTQRVKEQAIVINRKPQTPTVSPSSSMLGIWEKLKLRP